MSTFTVLNPATEEPVTTLTQASAADADAAIARASAGLAGGLAGGPRPDAARVRRGGGRRRRRTGRPRGVRLRPSHRGGPVGGRAGPRCAAVLLGGAGTTERQADPGARRAERH